MWGIRAHSGKVGFQIRNSLLLCEVEAAAELAYLLVDAGLQREVGLFELGVFEREGLELRLKREAASTGSSDKRSNPTSNISHNPVHIRFLDASQSPR